jgi:hypothetical protein
LREDFQRHVPVIPNLLFIHAHRSHTIGCTFRSTTFRFKSHCAHCLEIRERRPPPHKLRGRRPILRPCSQTVLSRRQPAP